MESLGLEDAPHSIGRAFDFAHSTGEVVGRWDEVSVGEGPVRIEAPCADVPWLTGLWGRRGSRGPHVLAYLDPAPKSKGEQDAAVWRLLRDVPEISSLRFADVLELLLLGIGRVLGTVRVIGNPKLPPLRLRRWGIVLT